MSSTPPPPPPPQYNMQPPSPGAPPKKKFGLAKGCALGCGILFVILVIIGIVSVGSLGVQSKSKGSTQTNIENMGNPSNLFKSESDVVTLEEYNKLHNGMTYEQVVEIIGDAGVEQASTEMPSIQGMTPAISTKMYMWMNSGVAGGNMNAMFQNNSMISKAQFGLK